MTYQNRGALLTFRDIVGILAVGGETAVSYPGLLNVFAACDCVHGKGMNEAKRQAALATPREIAAAAWWDVVAQLG
jgi:hypothetical protein